MVIYHISDLVSSIISFMCIQCRRAKYALNNEIQVHSTPLTGRAVKPFKLSVCSIYDMVIYHILVLQEAVIYA